MKTIYNGEHRSGIDTPHSTHRTYSSRYDSLRISPSLALA